MILIRNRRNANNCFIPILSVKKTQTTPSVNYDNVYVNQEFQYILNVQQTLSLDSTYKISTFENARNTKVI